MKHILRGLLFLAVLAVIGAAGLAVYVARTWDRTYEAPMPAVRISRDRAVLARGEYLVYGPAHCSECHGAQAVRGERFERPEPLSGGFRLELGPLGAVYAANLTPDPETGIGRYTDGQIARMMRWSVKPDGHAAVEPLMPFGNMSDEDLNAVISYLRAQPPVRNVVPRNQWTMLGKVVKSVTSIVKPREAIDPPAVAPAEAPTRERGAYLARSVANCVGCHTPRNESTFVATGPEFSGGFKMEPAALPGVDRAIWFISPNITPAKGGGLSNFTERDVFVARFQRGGRKHAGSPMPWEEFSHMSAADIGAIYEFLRSLPAQDGPTGDPTFRQD